MTPDDNLTETTGGTLAEAAESDAEQLSTVDDAPAVLAADVAEQATPDASSAPDGEPVAADAPAEAESTTDTPPTSAEAPDLRISIRIATAGLERIALLAVSTPKTDLISRAIDVADAPTLDAEVETALAAVPELIAEAQERWSATPRYVTYKAAPKPRAKPAVTPARATTARAATTTPIVPESRVTTIDLRSGAVSVTAKETPATSTPEGALDACTTQEPATPALAQPSLF